MAKHLAKIDDRSLISLFKRTVELFPDRCAVADEFSSLSYSELDKLSDNISGYLTGIGFGGGQIAIILMDRTKWAIACMIGVLKSGGAYLFLEHQGAFLRNKEIISESSSHIILTRMNIFQDAESRILYESIGHVVDVETMQSFGKQFHVQERVVGIGTAYVIYTSGSTGKPKGAINRAASIVNLVDGLHELIVHQYESTEALNIAVLAPFVFDPCVQQIFVTILHGHCLHIVPELTRLDGRELIRFFNDRNISISDGTPTHLKLLQQTSEKGGRRLAVKHFIIGGEPLAVETVEAFLERFDEQTPKITNIYGVAECCVDSTCYTVNVHEIQKLGFVPIGKPMPGARVLILDSLLREIGPGETGELCIGECCIGSGYLQQPELTSERFISDPQHPEQKLYKTGDLATLLPDGNIQLHGRIDRQIKIRGHRIEPGEVESVIRKYVDRPIGPVYSGNLRYCTRCLLTDSHPGITIENGVCSACKHFDSYKHKAIAYFHDIEDFRQVMEKARNQRRTGNADALLLYSGGKDSTYVLLQLIAMGYKVETFTFDNGFISKTAFKNIERITNQYGIKHVNCTIDNMDRIFNESLANSSTVCNGCFKSLTMLSTKIAHERGINVIITGLSRGQIYDTKLKKLFDTGIFDIEEIDRRLLTHRKIFYSQTDIVSNQLNMPADDSIYDIHYLDFFRYSNVSSSEVKKYLADSDSFWIAPKDTGLCSTNCLINNVGIHVHKMEKGYHNYAEPLSWDCRLGVSTREHSLKELESQIDVEQVEKILKHLKYVPKQLGEFPITDTFVWSSMDHLDEPCLTAYFTSSIPVDVEKLRSFVAARLPEYMVPKNFFRIDQMPIGHNGKVDVKKLPHLHNSQKRIKVIPSDTLCAELTNIWMDVLNLSSINIDDNFFDMGGHSLTATILVNLVEKKFGTEISVIDAVKKPTIRLMAEVIRERNSEWMKKQLPPLK
jgi:amino acid adenylation domain-containing protein